jgi:hypothetical protein
MTAAPVAPVIGVTRNAGYTVRAVLPADVAGREWLVAAEDSERGRRATWHAWARDDGTFDFAWGRYFAVEPVRGRALADLAERAGITHAG